MRPSVSLAFATTALLVAACGLEPSGPDTAAETAAPAEAVTAARAGFGGITIALDMRANRTTDIAYTTVGRKLKGFSLDDDSDPTLPSSRTFTRLKPGAYTVQQTALTGVTMTAISCVSNANGGGGTDNNSVDLPNRAVTIRLERDEAVTCTFTASMTIWAEGDFLTYPQGDWGDDPAVNPAAALLDLHFNQVYTSGTLEVGIAGTAGFSLVVDGNGALAYLPAPGTPGVLTSDLFNPSSSSAGSFGGDVVALELNTDFASAGLLTGGNSFGNLALCNVPGISAMTVNAFLAGAHTLLGGGSTGFTVATVAPVAAELNASFFDGTPTMWAQDHLVSGACP